MEMKFKKTACGLAVLGLALNTSLAFSTNFKEVGQSADDTVITAAIKTNLAADKLASALDVSVTTKNDIVYLKGVVKTDSQYERAVTIAEATDGVVDVDTSNLKIEDSHQAIADILLTSKIKAKLISENIFSDKDISLWTVEIETQEGKVYLSGTVKKKEEKQAIVDVVKSTEGAKLEVDDIRIKS